MWRETITKNIVRPVARRLATAAGGGLSAAGLATGEVEIVVAAIPIVAGLAVDLIFAYANGEQ